MSDLNEALEGKSYLLFDGAMGTMLQRGGLAAGELPELLCLNDPQKITGVHRAYVEAGSQVITTNTFGANMRKLGSAEAIGEVFEAAVGCARDAGARYVAADIGPLGELMFPMGELGFTQACEDFAVQARAARAAGADLAIVETMSDLLEAAAAVIAIKEACDLPVLATMTFTESGRTFLGTPPAVAAVALELVGADAVGVNCSAGPVDLQPVVNEMLGATSLPVVVQANAGLPEVVGGKVTYSLDPESYAQAVEPMVEAGATVVGGCCGTDPSFIRALSRMLEGRSPAPRRREPSVADTEGQGRDGEIMDMVREADSLAALKVALAEEYDPD